jgi:hypothetical protein
MTMLVAFGPIPLHPLLRFIVVIIVGFGLLLVWNFIAARGWRWSIVEFFIIALALCAAFGLFEF